VTGACIDGSMVEALCEAFGRAHALSVTFERAVPENE